MRVIARAIMVGGFCSVVVVLAGCDSRDVSTSQSVSADRAASKPGTLAAPARLSIAGRASCSSLVQIKQPLETVAKSISEMGYPYLDLSCLSWAPHASVVEMGKDFEKEAGRVESVLAANRLKVSNLTLDAVEIKPYAEYEEDFRLVVKLAARLKARLINIMAPSKGADWADQVKKLKALQAIAAESGVILTVETHANQITELPADAERLCKEVPGLGLTLDPSHYYAGPNQGRSFDALYPLVQGTGFRAGGMSWDTIQMPWGEGPIDFAGIVAKLEAAGYKGFYVVEYLEGFNTLDPLAEARKFLAWAKGL
ncbi:MAG TPA: sugar phosphate isomerase/epimerase [Phycisphaerae bacterium]|nr:sugar phosphate isomerase/epimerase [Phycisphaerae bacterium]HRY67625.1 sugar phosphate isomerase/epimerase [Phycisphaerae bacterium]HSA25012.1 sugar phosphate isomerase/epimerase [Phycisphaerae bacterium]